VASGGAVDPTESADPTIIVEGSVDKGKGRAMENEGAYTHLTVATRSSLRMVQERHWVTAKATHCNTKSVLKAQQ